jgi:hypothetical protein
MKIYSRVDLHNFFFAYFLLAKNNFKTLAYTFGLLSNIYAKALTTMLSENYYTFAYGMKKKIILNTFFYLFLNPYVYTHENL